jgi:cytochrome c
MKAFGGEWTWERLAKYLHKPAEAIPDNKMVFEGVKDDRDLADLLVHLRKLADTPAPLPK